MEVVIVFVAAVLCGIVAGLTPGIGPSLLIIAFYPVLSKLSVMMIFFFYIVMDNTSQYYSSISAIIFGVMGEPTSAPAVINGHELYRRGEGSQVLSLTATSSFIASVFGLILFCIIANYSSILTPLLSGKVKVAILVATLAVILYSSKSKILGVILMATGLVLGSAGSDVTTFVRAIFPKASMFGGGIPFEPLMVGFIVVPVLLHAMRTKPVIDDLHLDPVSAKERLTWLAKVDHWWSILRGSAVGCLCGIIPGVSYAISSNMAEAIEKVTNKNASDSRSLMQNVVSAEAANNAGAVTCLAPLLIFAIPIMTSESLILNLAEFRGFNPMTVVQYVTSHIFPIAAVMFGINMANWLLSGYCYNWVASVYLAAGNRVYSLVMALCIGVVIWSGISGYHLPLTLLVLGVSAVLGLLVKDYSTRMTCVFAFFIADDLIPELIRLWLIYS